MKFLFCILCISNFANLSSASEQILATVGNTKITLDGFKEKLENVRRQAVNPPTPEQFLEDQVRFEVGVQQAEKLKLQNDPLVQERIRQVLYNELLEKELGKPVEDIKISERELHDYYKKNPEVHVAHILIEVKEGANAEERAASHKRAKEILEEVLKSKRGFEELVRLYTDDLTTKETGGDLGFQSRMTLVPVVYDTALAMRINEVKGLIETPYGFQILKLLERRPFDLADKRQIRAAVFNEKRGKLMNEYFESLKKQYKIEVNREGLRALR